MPKIDNKRVGSWRWVVALLLFAIATVNYIDRVNISFAAPFIQAQYHINDFYILLSALFKRGIF